MAAVIIIDGDNTLWDTNAIFTEAQMNILEELKNEGLDIDPETEFHTLRSFDDMLVKKYRQYEYDFRVLALALYLFYNNWDQEKAIEGAFEAFERGIRIKGKGIARKCYNAFKKKMQKFPPLFNDVKKTLAFLKDKLGNVLILISEGDKDRIRRVIRHLNIGIYFDYVIGGTKSVKKYREAASKGLEIFHKRYPNILAPKTVVVGDLLDRDILLGNKIGAITVHKPGGYKPDQKPRNKMEYPNYKIKNIVEIIEIITRL